MKKRNIAILGSTGSIGRQALEVIEAQKNFLRAGVLVAWNNADLLVEQAIRHRPDAVVILNEAKYSFVRESLRTFKVKVLSGEKSMLEVLEWKSIDMVLSAIVGFAGLQGTYRALECAKSVALANKESLVVAGDLLTHMSKKNKIPILPVDSEHSAIFQCLQGEDENPIEKIIITASGGPFRGKNVQYLKTVSCREALQHPNWRMGDKITIDSATLMNKGLEVIEARWLFDLPPDKIEVMVHPQSIIHSMVQFSDGSVKAQMGLPDMRLPIQYALCYPHRLNNTFPRYDFTNPSTLHFEKPDMQTFPCLLLAYEALKKGGNYPCVLNAANEVGVDLFLKEKIRFTEIPQIIEYTLGKVGYIASPSMDDYLNSDKVARHVAMDYLS